MRIANMGLAPLSGEGILVFVGMRVLYTAPTDSTIEISIPEAILRDDPEKPPVVTHPGTLTIQCGAGAGVADEDSQSLRIQRIGPAEIRWYHDSGNDSASELRIYDARGRLITTVKPKLTEDTTSYTWTGCDHSGKEVARGIYFYEAVAGGRRWTGKVHISR